MATRRTKGESNWPIRIMLFSPLFGADGILSVTDCHTPRKRGSSTLWRSRLCHLRLSNTGSPAGACHRVACAPTRWRVMTTEEPNTCDVCRSSLDCSSSLHVRPTRKAADRIPVAIQKYRLPVFRLRQAEHAPLRHQRHGDKATAARRLRPRLRQGLRDGRQGSCGTHRPRRHRDGQLAAGAWLWRSVAARWIYLHVGTDRRDLLQCGSARVFVGAGEAGGVLNEMP